MEDNKISILRELLQAFNQKTFDLEAWKIKASIILKKIFGDDDEKVELINQLHYDYSSWNLRDHSGGKQHDSVSDQAKEIIETAIIELELSKNDSPILEIFQKHYTGAEFDELQLLINNNSLVEEKLTEYFSKITNSKKDLILAQIILKFK